MSDQASKDQWVLRVLGVQVAAAGQHPGTAQAPDPAEVTQRLQSAGTALRALRDSGAPGVADLLARYSQVVNAAKTAPTDAAARLDALEADLARATSAGRAREATPAKGRGVAYRKLLLRWREAQGTLDANLKSVGTTLLARPDIKADPRLGEIEKAVADLPKLVPAFGGELEGVLGAAMSTDVPAELERLTAEGIVVIDAYRQQLAAAAPLLELETFAAKDLGADVPLHAALDQALVELKQQLAA
jgi:hypothetical protein